MINTFINAMQQQPTAFTENGAAAYGDTGSDLVNYFSNTNNLHRSYEEIEADLNKCWKESPEYTLRMIMYIRAITRKSEKHDIKVKGLGMKNEGRLALKWLYNNHKKVFHKNLPLFIEFGNWQDLWHRQLIDWVEQKDMKVASFIGYRVFHNDLCKKYLPRYKSKSNIRRNTCSVKTIEFKELRNKGLGLVVKAINDTWPHARNKMTMKILMKLKAKGKAHDWQQRITNQAYLNIDFNTLPGKVISWMFKEKEGSSFLSRHNLEDKYIVWLDNQTSVKTTSYIYELVKPAIEVYNNYYYDSKLSKITKHTIEKQIKTILKQAEVSNLNVMPVIDTSGSMHCIVSGNVTALDICVSLGVFFSMLQKGTFKDHIIGFSNDSKFQRLSGSYLDRLKDVLANSYMGSTNFQSVIDLIVRTRQQNLDVPVEDYPNAYLVISDMAFNESGYGYQTTNHQTAVSKLTNAGLPEPIFIWYNVSPYDNKVFQNHKDDSGVIQMAGFDPAAVDRLMSADFQLKFEEKHGKSIKDITPYEACIETLSQDYLKLLTL